MSKNDEVYSISSVRQPLSVDQDKRARKYVFSMTIRILCFIGAFWAEGWLRWLLLTGSLVLPWIAVVVANAGLESGRRSVHPHHYHSGHELD
jgi:hypothetical protein